MLTFKTTTSNISTDDLIKNYYYKDKIEGYCKKCSNYGALWSCPPFDFDTEKYIRKYEYLYVIGTQIFFNDETIEKNNTKQKIEKYSYEIIHKVRKNVYDKIISLESKYHGSVILNAGSCILCSECTRKNNKKCRFEKSVRYSLEALGLDVSKITENLLNIKLKWASDRLPEYYTVTSGFLTNYKVENSIVNNLLTN